jgi:DNA-binding YbaB/EbfC family protein
MSDVPDFSKLGNLFDMARRIQGEVGKVKQELATKTVDAESGGGLVRCVANGRGEIVSLSIDPSLLAVDNKKMLEDLVAGAVNLALDRARQLAQEDLARVAGGLPLPPGILE